MHTGRLGLVIAIVIGLCLLGVLAFMGSLLVANRRAVARARAVAERARDEAKRKLGRGGVHDLRLLLGTAIGLVPGMRVDIAVPLQPVLVFGDCDALAELLGRVSAHAARVMLAGATLEVRARVEGAQAVVHWRDAAATDAWPALARFFDALDTASSVSARTCERIACGLGGRIYSAPGASGTPGLTLRLPLHGAPM